MGRIAVVGTGKINGSGHKAARWIAILLLGPSTLFGDNVARKPGGRSRPGFRYSSMQVHLYKDGGVVDRESIDRGNMLYLATQNKI